MKLERYFEGYKKLVESLDMLTAIEKYYDDNIIQYESSGEPYIGKDILHAREESISEQVTFLSGEIADIEIDETKQRVTGTMRFFYLDMDEINQMLYEYFTQRWEKGKIVEQRFRPI